MNINSPWSHIGATQVHRSTERARILSTAYLTISTNPPVVRLPQIIETNTSRQRTLSNNQLAQNVQGQVQIRSSQAIQFQAIANRVPAAQVTVRRPINFTQNLATRLANRMVPQPVVNSQPRLQPIIQVPQTNNPQINTRSYGHQITTVASLQNMLYGGTQTQNYSNRVSNFASTMPRETRESANLQSSSDRQSIWSRDRSNHRHNLELLESLVNETIVEEQKSELQMTEQKATVVETGCGPMEPEAIELSPSCEISIVRTSPRPSASQRELSEHKSTQVEREVAVRQDAIHGVEESKSAEDQDKLSDPENLETKSRSGSGGAKQKTINPKNLQKRLVTSTGSGPEVIKEDMKLGKLKILKTSQSDHLRKFSNSLIFNSIERVTKAGSELKRRELDSQIIPNKLLYDFDSEEGQDACRRYLEAIENLFALSFLKRANRSYRQNFSAAYRVLYDNPIASPLNYLVEILDSAQEAFPYLWVNGKKYEFSEMVIQQGNMLYDTFGQLNKEITNFHLSIVTTRAVMTDEYCSISKDDLQKMRSRLERKLEQFDLDWSIFEKSYVQELMNIETDARQNVIEAIEICRNLKAYETEQKRKGKIFFTANEEYNNMRGQFLEQISQINSVANVYGQGRDDLEVQVLVTIDDISRKVSQIQSKAVCRLCEKVQKSFNSLRKLFQERYAQNVEVVDPQLRNNPELVHLIQEFEKDWCLSKTHLVPKQAREQLIKFSQMIEITCEKYQQFGEQVECRDAEIFLSIPYLLVLKSTLDTGKEQHFATEICARFFPSLFDETEVLCSKYNQLKQDFVQLRRIVGDHFFSFYNKIESQILLGSQTPEMSNKAKAGGPESGRLLQSQIQLIKEIAHSLTRHQPTEWNEFMIVALGVDQ